MAESMNVEVENVSHKDRCVYKQTEGRSKEHVVLPFVQARHSRRAALHRRRASYTPIIARSNCGSEFCLNVGG